MRKRIQLFTCFLGLFALARAADAPVPVVREPYHKPVFENEYVRVIDVQIPVGETTQYHVHAIASVVVYLTKSTNASQTWGEAGTSPRETTPGDSRYAPYDVKPLTHRVTNTGTTPFRVYDIELLHRPPVAVAPGLAMPPHVVPRWDEKLVRSMNILLAAGESTEVPANACAHLLVNVNAPVRAERKGDKAARQLRAQEFVFFPARTAFLVANAGEQKAEAVLLELR